MQLFLPVLSILLASLACGSPAEKGFSVQFHSSSSDIDFRGIHASGTYFYIGKPTTAYCPTDDGFSCRGFTNTTAFHYGCYGECGMGMAVSVPAGQDVFVNRTSGALQFVEAHEEMSGYGALRGFTYKYLAAQDYGRLEFNGAGFAACPVSGSKGAYKIFCTGEKGFSEKGCLDFKGLAANTTDVAFQYE